MGQVKFVKVERIVKEEKSNSVSVNGKMECGITQSDRNVLNTSDLGKG